MSFKSKSSKKPSFIRVTGAKSVTTDLTSFEVGTSVVEDLVGNTFTYNTETKRVVVQKDCLATIIGFGDGKPALDQTGTLDVGNGNFRLLVRRTPQTGNRQILIDGRVYIYLKKHTGSLVLPITTELHTGDSISVESCCYDLTRGVSSLIITIIEH